MKINKIIIIGVFCFYCLCAFSKQSILPAIQNFVTENKPYKGWSNFIINRLTNEPLFLPVDPFIVNMELMKTSSLRSNYFEVCNAIEQINGTVLEKEFSKSLKTYNFTRIRNWSYLLARKAPTIHDIELLLNHIIVKVGNDFTNSAFPGSYNCLETSTTNLLILDSIDSYLFLSRHGINNQDIRKTLPSLIEMLGKNSEPFQNILLEKCILKCYSKLNNHKEWLQAKRLEFIRFLHSRPVNRWSCFSATSTVTLIQIPTNQFYELNGLLWNYANINEKRPLPFFCDDIQNLSCPGIFPEKTNVADYIELIMKRLNYKINITLTNYFIKGKNISVFEVEKK